MRSGFVAFNALSMCVLFAISGCAVDPSKLKAPFSQRTVVAPAGTSPETVFVCAETALDRLHRQDDQWVRRVTRKDIGAGVLETGDFQEDNEMGFRISARHDAASGEVVLSIKGAGPYFLDLGVESAAQQFAQGLLQCLEAPAK